MFLLSFFVVAQKWSGEARGDQNTFLTLVGGSGKTGGSEVLFSLIPKGDTTSGAKRSCRVLYSKAIASPHERLLPNEVITAVLLRRTMLLRQMSSVRFAFLVQSPMAFVIIVQ